MPRGIACTTSCHGGISEKVSIRQVGSTSSRRIFRSYWILEHGSIQEAENLRTSPLHGGPITLVCGREGWPHSPEYSLSFSEYRRRGQTKTIVTLAASTTSRVVDSGARGKSLDIGRTHPEAAHFRCSSRSSALTTRLFTFQMYADLKTNAVWKS